MSYLPIFTPVIGALGQAIGTITEKIALKKKKVNPRVFQAGAFFAVILIMLPLILIFKSFFWHLDSRAFELKNIIIFSVIVIFSFIANIFYFYSLKWEKITNLEPARLLEPIFVVFIAIIFSFTFGTALYERNFNVIIPALIAGAALIFSHIKKHHLEFNKYFIAAILGSFFFAIEMTLSKIILEYYSPMSLYFLRCFFVFLISFAVFKPKFSKLNAKVRFLVLTAACFWVVFRVATYYGYVLLGVVKTTLILMLAPVFIYLFAHTILKERLNWRNIAASIIIVGCIVYVLLT